MMSYDFEVMLRPMAPVVSLSLPKAAAARAQRVAADAMIAETGVASRTYRCPSGVSAPFLC